MNLNVNLELSRAYYVKTNVTGYQFLLILAFKQYENANNANFKSFEKPLIGSGDTEC